MSRAVTSPAAVSSQRAAKPTSPTTTRSSGSWCRPARSARCCSSASNDNPTNAQSGYLPGTMASAEEILMQVIDRRAFKPTSEECPFCREARVKENGSKCLGICRNPQNVPGPLVYPHEMQTIEDAVDCILFAMRDNDVPRMQHGIQVLWEYAVEHGNMERSRFFGWSSDST